MSAIHPGELIAPLLLEPAGISQSELARRLGFNQPQPVNELIKGKRGFTPKMALLFERVSGGKFPAFFWLAGQALYDASAIRSGVSPGRRAAVDPLALAAEASMLAEAAGCADLLALSRSVDEGIDATDIERAIA